MARRGRDDPALVAQRVRRDLMRLVHRSELTGRELAAVGVIRTLCERLAQHEMR